MFTTETTVLLNFKPAGNILFIFGRIVIPAFAFCTSQGNYFTHPVHLLKKKIAETFLLLCVYKFIIILK